MIRSLTKRGLLGPVARAAIISWLWRYRHEFLRWGRSMWMELLGRGEGGISPTRALRTGQLLMAIASDDRLRNAPELKRVTLQDGVVDLQVKTGWRELPRLLDRVRGVKGIEGVTVNGTEVATVTVA
jgi:hypothetical protein